MKTPGRLTPRVAGGTWITDAESWSSRRTRPISGDARGAVISAQIPVGWAAAFGQL